MTTGRTLNGIGSSSKFQLQRVRMKMSKGASESETFTQPLQCACIMDLPIPTGDTSVIASRIPLLSILNSRKDPAPASVCRDVPDGRHVPPCVCMWRNPAFCSFSRLSSQPSLQQVKPILHLTNRCPLALKSRGVVEFTAAEGLVTRNKSSSPVFR